MNAMKMLAIGIALCLLGSSAAAEDKKTADLGQHAVGMWEVVKTHEGGPPKGGTVEFTKDGKIKVAGEQDGKRMEFDGTYKINGNKMILNFKIDGKEVPVELTIDKLDENTFATTSKEGKVELTRKKK